MTHRFAGNFEGNQCRVSDWDYYGAVPECYVAIIGKREREKCPVPICGKERHLKPYSFDFISFN